MVLWLKAQRAGYVDEHYQPLLSRTLSALLADAMAERLGIKEKWKERRPYARFREEKQSERAAGGRTAVLTTGRRADEPMAYEGYEGCFCNFPL